MTVVMETEKFFICLLRIFFFDLFSNLFQRKMNGIKLTAHHL